MSSQLGATAAPGPFGLGSQIFGGSPPEPENKVKVDSSQEPESEDEQNGESDDGSEEDDDEELVTAMASASLDTSEWAKAPSYPALYLSTTAEYLPPAPKSNVVATDDIPEDSADGKKIKDAFWTMEGYENSLDIDHAFERFSKRVGYEAEQCIRYVSVTHLTRTVSYG